LIPGLSFYHWFPSCKHLFLPLSLSSYTLQCLPGKTQAQLNPTVQLNWITEQKTAALPTGFSLNQRAQTSMDTHSWLPSKPTVWRDFLFSDLPINILCPHPFSLSGWAGLMFYSESMQQARGPFHSSPLCAHALCFSFSLNVSLR
jgi:hypothetical protein